MMYTVYYGSILQVEIINKQNTILYNNLVLGLLRIIEISSLFLYVTLALKMNVCAYKDVSDNVQY